MDRSVENPRILEGVRGHVAVVQNLSDAVLRGKLASTMLFVGPSGVGRKLVALGILQRLVCDTGDGCGTCGPCRRVSSGQSESLMVIEPTKNAIKVEQAREILDFLSLRGLGRARAIIVDSCHLMNPATSNALLKALEEPPENTYFFLLAPSPRHVLPTIRSRAQVVRFAGLSIDDMQAVSKEARVSPRWMLEASRGSLDRLQELAGEGDWSNGPASGVRGVRALAMEFLGACGEDDPYFLAPEWRDFVKAREQAIQFARQFLLIARDLTVLQTQPDRTLINEDQRPKVQGLLALWSTRLDDLNSRILRLEPALAGFRDPVMTFEEFWISLNRH